MEQPDMSTVGILEQLKTSSNCDEVEHLLQPLFVSFEKEEDRELSTDIIAAVLGAAVQILPPEDVDHLILQQFMPLVKQHLCKILSSIHSALKLDISQDLPISQLTKSLEICVQILSDVESLLAYFNNMNKMPISLVFHLPKHVAEIVHQVFVHCQRSKEEYKESFPAMRNQLMTLFQKCYKLQLSLFTLLNEKVVFSCTFENELCLLIEVLDILGSMAEIVADLDTMSLVAHWKGYAQLTQNYATHLRPRLEVAGPIKYLSINISHQLCSLQSLIGGDKKVILRSLKISSLQLKVLVKLCEHYKGYLGDCHEDLLNCVITLAAHTGQYLSQQGFSEEIKSQVTANISAGAGPLLTHLITDPCFIKEYFQHADSLHSCPLTYQLGYCNLTNLILKKLIQLSSKDEDVQELSMISSLLLIDTVFLIMKECSIEGEMLLIQDTDIYEALLEHAAAFTVVTCTCELFPQLEKILVKHLLQPYLWPALFSSDLFCLIGRLGTSELCFQLTCLLHEVLSSWPTYDRHRPEWVYVSWTQNRLISLLSSDHLQTFRSQVPSLSTLASDITTLLSMPATDKTVSLLQAMIDKLSFLGETMESLVTPNQTLAEALYQLWQYMSVPLPISTESSHWFLGLYSVLITATCKSITFFSTSQIINILDILLKICNHKVTMFHCGACEFLRCLANQTFDATLDEAQFSSRTASLFVMLILDTNLITKQVAMETFSYFAHVVKYPQVIAETVSSNTQLQAELLDFIEGVPAGSSEKSLNEYLKCFEQSFVHKCLPISHQCKSEIKDIESNPRKKPKICVNEELVSSAIQRIDQDLCFIEEYSSMNILNKSSTTSLRNFHERIRILMNVKKIKK